MGDFDPDALYGFGFKCVNIGKTRITGFEVSAMGEGKLAILTFLYLQALQK